MTLRDNLIAARAAGRFGDVANQRAAAVGAALTAAVTKAGSGGLHVSNAGRSAVIYGVAVSGPAVTVYLDEAHSDSAALVVVNPPTLVRDAAGSVVIPSGKHREDPLQAIIHAVCEHGGRPISPNRVIPRG